MNIPRAVPTALTAMLLAAGLAACGDDESEGGESAATTTQAETSAPEATAAPGDAEAIAAEIAEDTSERPQIPAPEGEPPAELQTATVVEGEGEAAKAGDTVTVQYAGANWSNGQEFDASWERGEPFPFELGAGDVIPGWDEGVAGMKPGERRVLVIPPDMAYGPQGAPPAIGPNETLVFVVDLVEIG